MKKFRYLLFIFGFMFCMNLNVNATDGKLDTPSQHNWYVSSSANCYTSSGTSLTTNFITNTYSYKNISFNPYYQCNNFSSGDILAFNLGEKTSVNQLYSLTIYVGNANNAYLSNTSTSIGLGNYNAQSATSLRTGNPTRPTLYSYSDSYNILTYFYQPTEASLNEVKTGTAYVIFKANTEYPFFALKLYYSSAPSNIYFWGYKLTALGDTSGLTSSQVSNIVNNAVSDNATSKDIVAIQKDIATSEKNIKNQIEESTKKIDDTINNTDVSDSTSTANSFFEGFQSDDYGLSDIITMPLELIRGLTSNTCVALNLTIPFVNKSFDLPCMSSIYQEYFGGFYNLYQIVTFGFISYWVIVRIFNLVKDFKNPDHDEIEVLDL